MKNWPEYGQFFYEYEMKGMTKQIYKSPSNKCTVLGKGGALLCQSRVNTKGFSFDENGMEEEDI